MTRYSDEINPYPGRTPGSPRHIYKMGYLAAEKEYMLTEGERYVLRCIIDNVDTDELLNETVMQIENIKKKVLGK